MLFEHLHFHDNCVTPSAKEDHVMPLKAPEQLQSEHIAVTISKVFRFLKKKP